MFLRDVEKADGGPHGDTIKQLTTAGIPVPGLMRLTAFKPDRTNHLCRFVQVTMRGPSPLEPGLRELIAAFVSRHNECGY